MMYVDPSLIPKGFKPVAFRVPTEGEYYYSQSNGYRTCKGDKGGKRNSLPYLIFEKLDDGEEYENVFEPPPEWEEHRIQVRLHGEWVDPPAISTPCGDIYLDLIRIRKDV
jgi:hypothetical protein